MEGGRVMELTHLGLWSPMSVNGCSPPFIHIWFHLWASVFLHEQLSSFVAVVFPYNSLPKTTTSRQLWPKKYVSITFLVLKLIFFLSWSQFMVVITSHSDPDTGFLHIAPNNAASVLAQEVYHLNSFPIFDLSLSRHLMQSLMISSKPF